MANDMNFCPGCGQPLQPDANFCPKCGRQLGSQTQAQAQPKQKGFSFSKLRDSVKDLSTKAKESKIGSTVAGAASGVVAKVKDRVANINQWDGELVRTHPLTLPDNVSDQIVYKGKGGGILKGKFATFAKDGKIVLTRKAVQFYDVPFGKSLIPGKKHDASKLVYTINLADIDSIKKETNKLGLTSILVTSKGEVCDITAAKDPSRFLLFLTRLAGIEGNLLNIKLRENEKVIETCNIEAKMDRWGVGWRNSTIYLTNQRIVINHGGDANEGWLLSYEIDKEKIKEITEEKQSMNCLYTIISDGEPVVIKFRSIVPSWFLGMVKNGEGNAAQLKRKGNLMKGVKVAMIAGALLGATGDADADTDVDVDTDSDFDMDGDMVDMDGDGIDDTMLVDTDGDGMYDTAYIDTDGDGTFDSMAVDVDGDGSFDAIGVDTDGDGAIDTVAVDADGDGNLDTMAVDVDGDGTIDAVGMDTNGDGAIDTMTVDADGDGVMDTKMVDVDGDGSIDAVGVDTDGDGAIDTMTVDADGDGVMDTTMVDVDGDGTIDAVGMDTDGDGAIDTVGVDTDGDGAIDSIGLDTDGDGAIDTVGVDVDGNGSIDAVGVDLDGNGTIDKLGIDTNGDGVIDTIR